MKKRIIGISLLFIIVFLCSACNGSVTRDIRHAGFSVSNTKFVCDDFYPENKDDTFYKKVKYFSSTHIIDKDGKIYEVSLGQVFENKQNCKKANTDIIVKAIYDNRVIKGDDNQYYYLEGSSNVPSYSLIYETDNSYELYDLLLSDPAVEKVVTADSSRGIYYILKSDGVMYSYTINKADYNSPLRIVSRSIIYDDVIYDAKIIDFNYVGESTKTYFKTENGIYRMLATNYDSCSKYADVKCIYELKLDETLTKYMNRIIAYNGEILITDYKQEFNVSK